MRHEIQRINIADTTSNYYMRLLDNTTFVGYAYDDELSDKINELMRTQRRADGKEWAILIDMPHEVDLTRAAQEAHDNNIIGVLGNIIVDHVASLRQGRSRDPKHVASSHFFDVLKAIEAKPND